MSFFSELALCDICSKQTGLGNNKKHLVKDGVICQSCFQLAGFTADSTISETTLRTIKQQIEHNKRKTQVSSSFVVTRSINNLFFIDDESRKWYCVPGGPNSAQSLSQIHSFDELSGAWVEEDGTMVTSKGKSGLGRAVAGGVLFGETGAIVGAITGKVSAKSKTVINNIAVLIQLKSMGGSTLRIVVSSSVIEYDSAQYNTARSTADSIVSAVESILSSAPEASAPAAATFVPDPTSELRKYKALLDDGIITQNDFDAKKKQLLGL